MHGHKVAYAAQKNQNNYKLKNLRKYLLKSHANYISDNISTFRNINKYVVSKKEVIREN